MDKIAFINVVDKKNKEYLLSPEQLIVGGKSLLSQIQDLKEKYNQVLETNKNLQEENILINNKLEKILELLQNLQKNVEDVTTFSMEE
ncbi:MAG: hypothetical protein ACI4PF_04870 [Christensenellales bacterium]